jgi:FkbM family methyltransferase
MKKYSQEVLNHIDFVRSRRLLPKSHKDYLIKIKKDFNFYPEVAYDIGSCAMHWTDEAVEIWPETKIILFDAIDMFYNLYSKEQYDYHLGVLSNESNKIVKFYQNDEWFGGNSYYRENPKYSKPAEYLYDDSKIIELPTITLDDVVKQKSFSKPNLIKIDVQGAELDVLMGATECLKTCEHVIAELRDVEYNIGSPEKEVIIEYLASQGFKNMGMFSNNGPDGDYHFMR